MRENGYMILVMSLAPTLLLYFKDPVECMEYLGLVSPLILFGIGWMFWKAWTLVRSLGSNY